MTKEELQTIMEIAGIKTNTLELKMYLPSEEAVVYMQVGDGSQLDGDCDDNGEEYNGYIDYKCSDWDDCENCFREGDGGIFEYVATGEDATFGELYAKAYDTLVSIYGDHVTDPKFEVQIMRID